MATALDDTAMDVVAALMSDGYKAHIAEDVVRNNYQAGQGFADNYRSCLSACTQMRSGGRLNISTSSKGQAGSASAPATRKTKPLAAAHVGHPNKPTPSLPGTPVTTQGADSTSGGVETELPRRVHSPEIAGSTRSPATNPAAFGAEKTEKHVSDKICGREGCGKKLTERNQSGFCAPHFADSRLKKPRQGAAEKKPSRQARGARVSQPVKNGAEPATNGHAEPGAVNSPRDLNKIEVSEFELDRLWTRKTIAEKAALIFGRQTSEA